MVRVVDLLIWVLRVESTSVLAWTGAVEDDGHELLIWPLHDCVRLAGENPRGLRLLFRVSADVGHGDGWNLTKRVCERGALAVSSVNRSACDRAANALSAVRARESLSDQCSRWRTRLGKDNRIVLHTMSLTRPVSCQMSVRCVTGIAPLFNDNPSVPSVARDSWGLAWADQPCRGS